MLTYITFKTEKYEAINIGKKRDGKDILSVQLHIHKLCFCKR